MGDTLGSRIRQRRQAKGWTLKELADRSHVSLPYLSDLERRPGNPTVDKVEAVAAALGCSVGDLLPAGAEPLGEFPQSLVKWSRSEEFTAQVKRIAERRGKPMSAITEEVMHLMAAAPRRSTGELGAGDWQRILDVYKVIVDE